MSLLEQENRKTTKKEGKEKRKRLTEGTVVLTGGLGAPESLDLDDLILVRLVVVVHGLDLATDFVSTGNGLQFDPEFLVVVEEFQAL